MQLGSPDAPTSTAAPPPAPPSSRITWDEGVIAEHDKDRGTRRKILEPKTPFRAPGLGGGSVCSAASDDDAGMGALPADGLAAALRAWDAGSETGSGA